MPESPIGQTVSRFHVDAEQHLTCVHDKGMSVFGYDPDELLHDGWRRLHRNHQVPTILAIGAAVKQRRGSIFTIGAYAKNGDCVYTRLALIHGGHGKATVEHVDINRRHVCLLPPPLRIN